MEYILEDKYVNIGECTAITYYEPLTLWDRLVFLVIGIAALFISNKLADLNKYASVLLGLLYALIISTCSIYGNHLLEMKSEYWPHEYHPKPIAQYDKVRGAQGN